VNNVPDFWGTVWDFAKIKSSKPYDTVVTDLSAFPGAEWFPGARLNFAENLLRYRDDQPAFIFKGETQSSKQMSYAELYDEVSQLAFSLKESGVGVGDRVVGYMPNLIETVVCMLAATSIGATWASCATDIGPGAAIERLGQVEPKVMITADGYFYKGKTFTTLEHAAEVAKGIPSLKKVIVVSYVSYKPDI
jgi:acetoacetyl-CoA synthetase